MKLQKVNPCRLLWLKNLPDRLFQCSQRIVHQMPSMFGQAPCACGHCGGIQTAAGQQQAAAAAAAAASGGPARGRKQSQVLTFPESKPPVRRPPINQPTCPVTGLLKQPIFLVFQMAAYRSQSFNQGRRFNGPSMPNMTDFKCRTFSTGRSVDMGDVR